MTHVLKAKSVAPTATVRSLAGTRVDRLGINTQDGLTIIRFADILYCEAMSNYCRLYLSTNQSHCISKPMKNIISRLPASDFIRTHQSYTVRVDEIIHVGQSVTLSNGKSIPIARSQRNTVLNILRNRIAIV